MVVKNSILAIFLMTKSNFLYIWFTSIVGVLWQQWLLCIFSPLQKNPTGIIIEISNLQLTYLYDDDDDEVWILYCKITKIKKTTTSIFLDIKKLFRVKLPILLAPHCRYLIWENCRSLSQVLQKEHTQWAKIRKNAT